MTDDAQHAPDQDALAAEYVLGTLDPDERVRAQTLIAGDAAFAARVQFWETRLGALSEMVDPVDPAPQMWERIKARVSEREPIVEMRRPDGSPSPSPANEKDRTTEVVALAGRLRRWRGVAALMSGLAAALAALVALSALIPDRLPASLRLRPQTIEVVRTVESVRTVEVPAKAPGRFVAVLQKDGGEPAFVLTVDLDARTFTMRRVGAEAGAGRSYELWLVSDSLPAPRSLGVVGAEEFTVRPALVSYDQDVISAATYAVSEEPEGGSSSGSPSGPFLWSGKLIEAVPPEPPQRGP